MAQSNEAPELPPADAAATPEPAGAGKSSAGFGQKLPWAIAALLFGLTVWSFLPSLQNAFIDLDDPIYITENLHVRNGFSWEGAGWAFASSLGGSWHPLTWFSLMLDCQIYGLRPAGHHLTDVLLHGGSSVLLFALLLRLTGAKWRSAFVAALFALHPQRVESVAWATERKDTLSTFFWMLTCLAYARHAELAGARSGTGSVKAKRFYALSLLLFLCGLMSKPMLVTLPVILLLLDWWPLGRVRFPIRSAGNLGLLREKLPFFALAFAIVIVTLGTQEDLGAISKLSDLTLTHRLANACLSYWRYLGEMVWPTRLAFFYPLPAVFPLWPGAVAAVALVAVTALLFRAACHLPAAGFGWLWYLVTLLPVIGVMQVGQQSHADRYTYVPMIGIYVLLAWGACRVTARLRQPWLILAPLGIAAVAACMGMTRAQLGFWKNTETLFRRSLAVTTDNALAEDVLGRLLVQQGRPDEGMKHLREAIRLAPTYAGGHNDLGVVLAQKGQEDAAIDCFQAALRLRPTFAEAHHNLGLALDHRGNSNEAIAQYQEAVNLKPDYATAQRDLGILLGKQGWLDEAIVHLSQAVELFPDDAPAHCSLGITLAKRGRIDEAIVELQRSLKLDPNNAEAHCNLGSALGAKGRMDEAITHLQAALKLKPDYPAARANLKIALDSRSPAASPSGAPSNP